MTKIGVESVKSRMNGNGYILVDDFEKLSKHITKTGSIGDASTEIEKICSKTNIPDSESPYVKRFVTLRSAKLTVLNQNQSDSNPKQLVSTLRQIIECTRVPNHQVRQEVTSEDTTTSST